MESSDLAALEAAGLYDPRAPNAAERLALIEWLAAQGAGVEQMIDATQRGGALTGLAGDLALRSPQQCFTLAEIAAMAGTSPAQIEQFRQAAGLPPAGPDEKLFSPADASPFSSFGLAAQIFGEGPTLHFIRVVGSAVARVAEAAVSLFLVNIEAPIRAAGGSEVALAKANLQVMDALRIIPPVTESLLRAHVEVAIRRMRSARRHEPSADLVRMTVGFVDLVGFTTLSRALSARELADLVAEFEAVAHDLVAARDGRLVKLIGDEVMFVTVEAPAACDVALALVERFDTNPTITPRGGLATGPLLMRSGDYYGPIVNLASRIADLAVPREILVSEEVAAGAGGSMRFEPAGRRMLKGFDEPVTLYAARRA